MHFDFVHLNHDDRQAIAALEGNFRGRILLCAGTASDQQNKGSSGRYRKAFQASLASTVSWC
jgi:hypothetical protein